MQKLKLVIGVVFGVAGLLAASASPAAAYGNGAAYQVGLSLNCQNPVTCVAGPRACKITCRWLLWAAAVAVSSPVSTSRCTSD